jgi:hypothetical protein
MIDSGYGMVRPGQPPIYIHAIFKKRYSLGR